MIPIFFSNYTKLENYMINEIKIKYKPSYAAGINNNKIMKTTVLKSVDNTNFYNDNLNDINEVKYTLYGPIGNQDENEKRFNKILLNDTEHIYLYRVTPINKKDKNYYWYGKYEIKDKNTQDHPGKYGIMRTIIVLTLKLL